MASEHAVRWIALGCLLWLLLMPGVALAENSADVVVTVTGVVADIPGGFTVTYIDDWTIGLSWTKGVGAQNTLIRAAYDRVPADRNDGVQVYYGVGTNTTHPVQQVGLSTIYYRAWSETAGGQWTDLFASGVADFVSNGFLFIGLLVMALTLTLASFRWKDLLLSYSAGLTWLGIGLWWILGGLTNLNLADPWVKVLVFLPLMMFAVVMLQLMNTEIRQEAGGKSWMTTGAKPQIKGQTSYEAYRDELRRRIAKRK